MDHLDGACRKGQSRVERGDGWIVPRLDGAEEDACGGRAVELEPGVQAGDVVGDDHPAEHGGYLDHVLALGLDGLDLLVLQRSVRRSEVDRSRRVLLDAAARADGLVVDLGSRFDRPEVPEPLLVDGIGERRTGAGERRALETAARAAASTARRAHEDDDSDQGGRTEKTLEASHRTSSSGRARRIRAAARAWPWIHERDGIEDT